MAPNNNLFQVMKLFQIKRFYSLKPAVKLDENVSENIEKAVFKPRRHPGRITVKTVVVPETIVSAIGNISEEYPMKKVINDGKTLARHLQYRFPPVEENELQATKKSIIASILQKEKQNKPETEAEIQRFQQTIKNKAQAKLKSVVYNWAPINFDKYNSLLYLHARFAPEYAVLAKIFYEITLRDENFKPRSFFDFGSGTGSATWAANLYWKTNIFEYFNVDSSRDMNDMALLLQQGGRENANANIKGTFYRQFLPANNVTYDLVVSAYSLLELPSLRSRLQTILNLWNKTAGYLIIIEHGTNAGFKIINQARDFVLDIDKENNLAHVFSPCPHDMICPRFILDTTPCTFNVSYMTLPFGDPAVLRKENYSYVVLKKGKRNSDDPEWPRIVRDPLVRSKHTICRLCTKHGKLEEIIFTASKHGKSTYYCARSSERGDRLPVKLEEK